MEYTDLLSPGSTTPEECGLWYTTWCTSHIAKSSSPSNWPLYATSMSRLRPPSTSTRWITNDCYTCWSRFIAWHIPWTSMSRSRETRRRGIRRPPVRGVVHYFQPTDRILSPRSHPRESPTWIWSQLTRWPRRSSRVAKNESLPNITIMLLIIVEWCWINWFKCLILLRVLFMLRYWNKIKRGLWKIIYNWNRCRSWTMERIINI